MALVDKTQVKRVRRAIGEPPLDSVVEEALTRVDQAAIQAEEDARLVTEVWDGVSPINGVPAEHFWKRQDFRFADQVYLLREPATGRVVYVQPHVPHVGGLQPMTAETVLTVAESHRSEIVQERAQARIMQRVMDILDAG